MPAYYDEKQKTWFCKFYYQDWTGERKQKLKRGFQTKRESIVWERSFLERQQGSPTMTFQALYDLYMEDMQGRLKDSTLTGRKYRIECRILPFFKNKQINQISPSDIRKWQNTILKADLTESYQRALNDLLNIIFNYAVKYYSLPVNPCHSIKQIGKAHVKSVTFWTLEEFNTFIAYVSDPSCKVAFTVLFYTGLRCGELLALTREDIDLPAATLRVNKTYRKEKNQDIITSPKTENSIRTVTLPHFLVECLENFFSLCYDLRDTDRIFPFTRRKLEHAMQIACRESGIKRIRLHDIRHSHVSHLIEMGFPALLIAERIGDTVDMVNNIYGHLYPNKHKEVADRLQEIVSR